MRIYEITTTEGWGDQTSSGMRVVRFRTPHDLAYLLATTTNEYVIGEVSELEVVKAKSVWSKWTEGAVLKANAQRWRLIEVEKE